MFQEIFILACFTCVKPQAMLVSIANESKPYFFCHTSRRLLAGIAMSWVKTSCLLIARSLTASKSLMPLLASRALSQASKCSLLVLVKLPW